MVFVAVRLAHHVGDHRAHSAELRVAEGVLGAGIRQELAVGVVGAFGDHDHAIAVVSHAVLDARQEALLVEGDLGEQDDVWRLARAFAREPARGGDPAGVLRDLHHEHLNGGLVAIEKRRQAASRVDRARISPRAKTRQQWCAAGRCRPSWARRCK